jgi:transposase
MSSDPCCAASLAHKADLAAQHHTSLDFEKAAHCGGIRWSRLGVFDRIFAALAGRGPRPERIMIDSAHLKAHRTAASLLKKGLFPVVSGARKAA